MATIWVIVELSHSSRPSARHFGFIRCLIFAMCRLTWISSSAILTGWTITWLLIYADIRTEIDAVIWIGGCECDRSSSRDDLYWILRKDY